MTDEDKGHAERLATLEERLRAHRDTVRHDVASLREALDYMHREINGPPRDESLKGRMHKVEGNQAAMDVAAQALRQANVARDRSFSRWEKLAALGIALLAAGSSVAALLVSLFG